MSDERPETILVVDDNPATLYATARVLRGAGFKVAEAETGLRAVESSRGGVDLVVLDVNLPDIDGFEVCRRIRSDPATARLPVIHLSATFVQDVDKVHGLEVGADGYLTHPVEPPVLVATVNAFLRTRRAEDALRHSEARFKAVFENALHGIALVSDDQIYLDANPAMCRLLGLPREGVVGKHASVFVPADRQEEAAAMNRALEAGGAWRGNLPLLRSDGRVAQLDWSVSLHSQPGVRLAIATDVTERLAIEAEREQLLERERAARAEAERANRLKDEFLAVVSHELRTPLTVILLWAKMLKSGGIPPGEYAEAFDNIEQSAVAQQRLIEDLLDVSRMMSGKLRLNVREADLAPVVHAAIEAARPMADAKQVAVVAALDDRAGRVRADPDRVQQVVWNLLNNAVKFTARGGRVEVSLRRVDGSVQIRVSDTGRGMSREFLPYLFERFRQADASTTRLHGGLGLGLAISKQLVELHGGAIRADSAGEGRGSTFTVELPLTGAPPAAGSLPPAGAAAPPSAPPPGRAPSLEGVCVLLVEDEPSTRAVVKRMLEQRGAQVTAVESASEALAAFRQALPHRPFGVVLSDVGMPVRDGYELIRDIRAVERQRGAAPTPAAALTAYARPEDRAVAEAAGFQAHVPKPVEPEELLATVAALAGRGN
ncbi:MAG TPA: response regulator [Tepidisphaeraceae bacterium]|nr:response regulator [Tepidisphaeraceae bacterium]